MPALCGGLMSGYRIRPTRVRCLWIFCVTAVLTVIAGGLAIPANAIINGAVVTKAPGWMAFVETAIGGGYGQQCSGALVASDWVLTAAHCVTTVEGYTVGEIVKPKNLKDKTETVPFKPIATSGMHVVLGSANLKKEGKPIGVTSVKIPPGTGDIITFAPGTVPCNKKDKESDCRVIHWIQPTSDVALLKLTKASAAQPVELGTAVNGSAQVYGYGVTTSDAKEIDGLLRTTKGRPYTLSACAIEDIYKDLCAERGTSSVANGDSGGPWLQTVNGKTAEVAVTSGSQGTGDAYPVSIADVHSWINSVIVAKPGPRWAAVQLPLPSDQTTTAYPSPEISTLACTTGSKASCAAVGSYANNSGDGLAHPFIDSGSGTSWTSAVAPVPANAIDNGAGGLTEVACGTTCAAVGQYVVSSGSNALIEGGAGSSWRPVEAPVNDATFNGYLSVVACGTVCVAAGKQGVSGSGVFEGLLEAGSGASWNATVAPLPANAMTPDNPQFSFSGAACSAATCLVYGTYEDNSGITQGLVETESGGKWTAGEIPYPKSAGTGEGFTPEAAACQSATSCTLVGVYESTADGAGSTAMVTGRGTSWQAVALPLAYVNATLTSVSCPTANSCTAAGGYLGQGGNATILTVTGEGANWKEKYAPVPPNSSGSPGGVPFPEVSGTVSCSAAAACVTVGGNYTDSLTSWPYIAQEQSGTWATITGPVPTPHTQDPNADLTSVHCFAPTDCIAIGTYAIPTPPGQPTIGGYWELPFVAVESAG